MEWLSGQATPNLLEAATGKRCGTLFVSALIVAKIPCPRHRRNLCLTVAFTQGYIPPNTERREEVLARKRQEYHNWVQQHYEVADVERSEDELAILHQIGIDVPRTAAAVDLFHKPQLQRCGAT